MSKRFLLLSSLVCCSAIFFIVGCTKYNTIVLEGEYSSLQGASIATFFSNWGKPSQFVYNKDGSSNIQWKNIYSNAETLAFLLPEQSLEQIQDYSSVVCEVSIDVDASGKVKQHTLLCSQTSQEVDGHSLASAE